VVRALALSILKASAGVARNGMAKKCASPIMSTKLAYELMLSLGTLSMIKRFRIWLARRILGNHCACYRMGYHNLCDYQQRSQDAIAHQKARTE
jgi:hypothetical protein